MNENGKWKLNSISCMHCEHVGESSNGIEIAANSIM